MRNTFLTILVLLAGSISFVVFKSNAGIQELTVKSESRREISPSQEPTGIPDQKVLKSNYHIYQSFNNCGPASLSMALSHYSINVTQEELGKALRPYQNPAGDNDDKSVTLEELGNKAVDYNLIPYHRPDGDSELLTRLVALDLPVITRTWLTKDEDIGHYRVVTGYDKTSGEIIQDDSYQGPNRRYSYEEFNELWSKFGYEYLVLVPPEKKNEVEKALSDEVDKTVAWEHAKQKAQKILAENPDDTTARFNLSVAEYYLGNYKQSVEEYEKVRDRLPFRTLWYQSEPIRAYFELQDYDKVFSITDEILNNQNRAYSELYIIRGDSYMKQNQPELAKQEYEKAVHYNENLQVAKDRLSSL